MLLKLFSKMCALDLLEIKLNNCFGVTEKIGLECIYNQLILLDLIL